MGHYSEEYETRDKHNTIASFYRGPDDPTELSRFELKYQLALGHKAQQELASVQAALGVLRYHGSGNP